MSGTRHGYNNAPPWHAATEPPHLEAHYPAYDASILPRIMDARIGMVDLCLLLAMWGLILVQSLHNFGRAPGAVFIFLNLILVTRNASNGLMILLMNSYTTPWPLMIPSAFVIQTFLAGMGYALRMGTQKRSLYVLNQFTIISAAFVVFSGLTLLYSDNRDVASYYYAHVYEGYIALMLAVALIQSRDDLGRVLKWWVILGALSVFVSLAHYTLGTQAFVYTYRQIVTGGKGEMLGYVGSASGREIYSRFIPTGFGPNYFSSYMLFPMGMALACYMGGRGRQKPLYLLAAAMIGFGILGTFSRSGFLAMCALVAMFFARRNIQALAPLVFVAIAGALAIHLIPGLSERLLSTAESAQEGGSGRVQLWLAALRYWFGSPFMGIGLASFQLRTGHGVHSVFIQILAEGGLIAFGLLMASIWSPLAACGKVKSLYYDREHPDVVLAQVIRISILALCLMNMTLGNLEYKVLWMQLAACYQVYFVTLQEYREAMGFAGET